MHLPAFPRNVEVKKTDLRIILVPVLIVTLLMLSLKLGSSQAAAVMETPDRPLGLDLSHLNTRSPGSGPDRRDHRP